MGADLEWHIDDDDGEGPWVPKKHRPVEPPPPARASRLPAALGRLLRRHPRLVLAAAGVLVVTAFVAGSWQLWQARRSQAEQKATILQVARLEDQLLARQDVDAYSTLQDPLYPGWREWQRHQARPDPEDPLAGLLQPHGAAAYGEVALDGALARLPVTRHYRFPGSRTQSFTLTTVQYYRFAAGGWLHTGPPAAATGEAEQVEGRALLVSYPAADAAAVNALLPALEALSDQACRDMGRCSRHPPRLTLTASAEELAAGSAGHMTALAPAPALLGLGDDESGRRALVRLYGARLVTAIALHAARGRAGPNEAWLHWELTRLGLAEPLDPELLRDAARSSLREGTNPFGRYDQAYAGVWLALDFLNGAAGTNPLRSLLDRDNVFSVQIQLAERTAERNDHWWDYLEMVAALELYDASGAELAVVCSDQVMLWRAATATLRPLGVRADGQLLWSPDGRHLAARTGRATTAVVDLTNGVVRETDQVLAWSPDGRRAVIWRFDNRFIWQPAVEDPENKLRFIAPGSGWVEWSPDGAHLAYANTNDRRILIAGPDGRYPRVIGEGEHGAWSADSRFLALGDHGRLAPPVEVYDVATGEVTTVLARTAGQLFHFAWAPATAGDGEPLLAVASFDLQPHDAAGYVHVVDRSGRVHSEWIMEGRPFDLRWSPDGRELGWATLPEPGGESEIFVVAIGPEDGPIQRFAALTQVDFSTINWSAYWGWSPDGRWVALDNNGAEIWDRAGAAHQRLPAGCHAPVWRPESE